MPKYLVHMEETIFYTVEIDVPHDSLDGDDYEALPEDVQEIIDNLDPDEDCISASREGTFAYLEPVQD